MSGMVVVDASMAAMWAVPEPYSAQALALADRWARAVTRILAPCLLLAEVTNAFYKRVLRREMDLATAQKALEVIYGFSIEIREEPGLQARAMELAHRLQQPTTYDCQYLALAEYYGCDLWTGDRRLFNTAKRPFPWVKWVGEHARA